MPAIKKRGGGFGLFASRGVIDSEYQHFNGGNRGLYESASIWRQNWLSSLMMENNDSLQKLPADCFGRTWVAAQISEDKREQKAVARL